MTPGSRGCSGQGATPQRLGGHIAKPGLYVTTKKRALRTSSSRTLRAQNSLANIYIHKDRRVVSGRASSAGRSSTSGCWSMSARGRGEGPQGSAGALGSGSGHPGRVRAARRSACIVHRLEASYGRCCLRAQCCSVRRVRGSTSQGPRMRRETAHRTAHSGPVPLHNMSCTPTVTFFPLLVRRIGEGRFGVAPAFVSPLRTSWETTVPRMAQPGQNVTPQNVTSGIRTHAAEAMRT